MKSLFATKLGAVVASMFVLSCGAPSKRSDDNKRSVTAIAAQRSAMTIPLSAITVRGELAVKTAGAWQPMIEGNTLTGVREVKTDRRGAIVALGDAATAPLLYLRAGSHVVLSQDGSGVHVGVLAGRARLKRGESVSSYIDTEGGEVIVTGDVMVDEKPVSRSDVLPTGARAAGADWSFTLQRPDTGAGAGRMEARPRSGSADKMEPLELRSVTVDVKTAGDQAITEVTHVFHNAVDERREGTFRFPLPDGAMLVGLAMEIEGKLVEGELVEREKARAVYEKIVDEMLDPALLEWEQGNWFKLRVFPLEAKADKKVVIRYIAPLSRGMHGWEYDYAIDPPPRQGSTMTAPDHGAIGKLNVNVDGQSVLAQRDVAKGVDLVVPVATAKVPVVMREARKDGVYTAVRIAPNLGTSYMPSSAGRKIAVVFDTSRSSMEGRTQALELLETTLKQLSPTDQFVVLASDVEVKASSELYVPVTAESIANAIAMIKAIEPDGASDIGNALRAVDERDPSEVIYVGDGIATWGEQRTDELAKLAEKIGAPIEAALIGKGASSALWMELSGRTGGRAMIVKSQLDEQRFALAATQGDIPRLTDARIVAPTGVVLFPSTAQTVFAGDEMLAVMKMPADQQMPASVKLTGKLGGQPFSQDIKLTSAVATDRVAQRWARQMLAMMEDSDTASKEEIVALSTEHGVMSKYTSLLVLENDEAYKQHQIERKNAAAQQAQQLAQGPTVTGGDLDTLGTRQASLSPDEIQPGDPEIKIPAPQDALSVVVSFPFGETKLAMWDEDVSAWMVRFLIDQSTADGIYYVRVAVTHADGRIELLKLPYTVDTKAPMVTAGATKQGTGYLIKARQNSEGGARKDADRVEVLLPDGTIMKLQQTAWGRFEGTWVPALPLMAPVTLRVVARDNALNQSTSDLVIQ